MIVRILVNESDAWALPNYISHVISYSNFKYGHN